MGFIFGYHLSQQFLTVVSVMRTVVSAWSTSRYSVGSESHAPYTEGVKPSYPVDVCSIVTGFSRDFLSWVYCKNSEFLLNRKFNQTYRECNGK